MHFGRPRFFAFSIQVVKNMILKKVAFVLETKKCFLHYFFARYAVLIAQIYFLTVD